MLVMSCRRWTGLLVGLEAAMHVVPSVLLPSQGVLLPAEQPTARCSRHDSSGI